MGYACPVCEVPQQDAEHLANHLAFTALLHEDDHADWLDESVPDWREGGPGDLAPAVADLAEESDYDAVFEDTTERHGHDGRGQRQGGNGAHRHGHDLDVDPAAAGSGAGARAEELDAEAESVLREARELTREMLDDGTRETGTETAGSESSAGERGEEGADGNS
jgi:hypothetical protein